MTEAEQKRLKLQQEANSAAIARMQMQLQSQGARRAPQGFSQEDLDDDEGTQTQHRQPPQQQQHQTPPQQQYQQVDPNQLILQAITNQATQAATAAVQQNLSASAQLEDRVKNRMKRLVDDYPALRQEDSQLVIRSRDAYARIANENPGLDEATRYELAVREAASSLGARPLNAPVEDYAAQDFVMPVGSHNPSLPSRGVSGKNRLTPNIIANAKLMGIPVDPATPEGKKNLAELNEYSARFNADQDETQYRYK